MSRRTSESNKTIAQAWEREKQRVSEGNGTRDWTPDQQRDILERGKAYDENGKAFEGQHMRSAEMHPECQGNPNNIQFLTREEHLAAHDGDWRNPTNWYYNPVTKEKHDFGNGPIIPCDVIELSEPLNIPIAEDTSVSDSEEVAVSNKEETINSHPETGPPVGGPSQPYPERQKVSKVSASALPTKSGVFFGFIKKAAKATGSFISTHKCEIIVGGLAIGGAVLKAAIDSDSSGSGGSGGSDSDSGSSYSCDFSPDLDADFGESTEGEADCDYGDSGNENDDGTERSSPREHDVAGYDRQQNGKTVHVRPHKRGGRNNDED